MAQTQRRERGVGPIDKALALKPDFADALNNRGNALQELKRFNEALASFDKALAIRPRLRRGAHTIAATRSRELKRLDEAVASYDKALAIKPDHVEALNNRGTALQKS